MNNKRDALGNTLNIGDYVIYSGRHKGLYKGRISKFTKIMVEVSTYDREYPQNLLKISESEYKNFKKHLKNG